MPNDDLGDFFPTALDERSRPPMNRTVLRLLIALLAVAVVIALWYLLFGGGGDDDASSLATAGPTAISIPTVTAIPIPDDDAVVATPGATAAPIVTPTPLPEGFEACGSTRSPSTTGTYIVDTNTTPLNQRREPAVDAELAGTFAPGQTGLTFTGNCVVNLGDGYVWWEIDNGTDLVWVASDFVTPG